MPTRWMDRFNNKGRIVEYDGVEKTVAEWAKECNTTPRKFLMRLYRGWSVWRTIETPFRKYERRDEKFNKK